MGSLETGSEGYVEDNSCLYLFPLIRCFYLESQLRYLIIIF